MLLSRMRQTRLACVLAAMGLVAFVTYLIKPLDASAASGNVTSVKHVCLVYWRGPDAEAWLQISPFSMFALAQAVNDQRAHVGQTEYSSDGKYRLLHEPACRHGVATLDPTILVHPRWPKRQ